MVLMKKLSVILLGVCLITLTGCQSNATSSSHKNTSSEVNQSKVTSPSKDDNQNDQSANVDSNNQNDQSSSDQTSSDQESNDNNSSNQSQTTTAPEDTNNNDSNNDQSNNTAPSGAQTINARITTVRLADSQTGWLGGAGWIAKTKDSGKSWTVQYQGEQTVHQIFALNHQNVWATFEDTSNSSTRLRLVSSNDGGGHWAPVSRIPNKGFLHFISKTIGFSGNAETEDGGRTWKTLPTPKGIVGDAYFHDTKNGWAVTEGKGIFQVMRTTDGGHSWKTVMSKKVDSPLNGVVIRSAGQLDAWVECIGGSGMTQTSYSLFHTVNGGKSFQVVIANTTAGGGPAPGFTMNDTNGPHNQGSSPGMLYVVNPNTAFMNGQCEACDNPNTIGWTHDGGKSWINGKAHFNGYGPNLLAFADGYHGWWITTENSKPSVLYITSDGGNHWTMMHTFK